MHKTNGTPATMPVDLTNVAARHALRADRRLVAHYDALTAKAAALDALVEAATVLVQHAQEAYPHFEDTRGQADIAATLAALSAAKLAQVSK